MEIQEKLLKFKFQIIFVLILSLALISLIILAPSFFTILAYFWPLFLSTALFLVAVIFFGKTSSLPSSAGEGLLDYVAGPHHPAVELVQPSHHDQALVEETNDQ